MPTIIDSLIVRLGLDSKPLDSSAPEAGRKLNELENKGKKTSQTIGEMTGQLGKFLALIGTSLALKQFVMDTIESNAQLERFSRNIGLSVNTVSAWGNAVEELGGSAKGLQGSMDMLSKAQTEMRLTGQSSLIPYFSALGVSLATVSGQAKPVDQILLDLSERFSHMDRQTANNMGRMMGIDQDTMNLLLQGRREVELMIARQKQYGAVTKEQAAESVKLQRSIVDLKQSFTALGRNLLEQASPMLEKVLGLFSSMAVWARNNSEFVGDFLKVIAVGLAAMGVAALPIDAVVVAVAALAAGITLLWQDYQTWKRGGQSLIDWGAWEKEINLAIAGIERLKGAIKSLPTLAKKAWNLTDDDHMKALPGKVIGAVKAAVTPKADGSGTAAQIQQWFRDHGLSAAESAGLAANVMSESGGRTNAVGDKGTAYGLLQWHPDRQANFAKWAGHDIRQSTLAEQLGFILSELTGGTEQSAGRKLIGATNAYDAGAMASKLYVRPRDKEGEASRRGTLAQTIAGIQGASAGVASAGTSAAGNVSHTDASSTTHIGKIEVITQATDANGIGRDIGHAMDFLFTSQANAGLV